MDNRKLIVWDLDDVMNEFTRDWLRLAWKSEHPSCDVRYDDLLTNPPLQALGTTLEEYHKSIDRFRLSEAGRGILPSWHVLVWFKVHGQKFRHAVLTARPAHTVAVAAEWVNAHFGQWIHSFNVAPGASRHSEQIAWAKAETLAKLGADAFVDDSWRNIESAASHGVSSFLFPQPWNAGRGYELDELLSKLPMRLA